MDLPYDGTLFHSLSRAGNVAEQNEGSPTSSNDKRLSALQAAARFGVDAVEVFGSIASQTIRYPLASLSSAASLVLQPGKLLDPGAHLRRKEEIERLARRTRLLQQLSCATSWPEYSETCEALDVIEGAEAWKEADDSDFYDVTCLRSRLKRLAAASANDNVEEMVHLVRCELTRDLGGMCNPELHHQTRSGTKFLIDHYVATVREVLDRIVRTCALGDGRLDKVDIHAELEQTRRSYGRTALLLSGGGTLGMSHIGVIKALHEANALPRIICGSSSGSIVAAVLGSTTDEELLPRLHDFCDGDLAVFVGPHEKQGLSGRAEHFRKNGNLFDLGNLRRVMVDLLEKTTFLEAYNRTRRILNIAVSTSTHYESQQVLNYATAGNVVIWSAVVASCAVPFGFEPERLLYKRDDDPKNLVPWDPSTRYIDGSVNADLPTSILSAEFDVNHSIVSQVNPHVAPFLRFGADSNGDMQTPYWVTAAALAKEEAIRSLDLLSDLPCLERNNNILSKLTSVLAQRYSGDITLFPVDSLARFWTILKNPTPAFMEQSRQQGERATWPVLNMIKTHMDIELLIDDAVRKVSEHVSFSQSVSNLRKLQLNQGKATGWSSGGRLRAHRDKKQKNRNSKPNRHSLDHVESRRPSPTPKVAAVDFRKEERRSSTFNPVFDSSASEDEQVDKRRTTAPRRSPPRQSSQRSFDVDHWITQTLPNSPTTERKAFLDSSRPASPGTPPVSLMMTPVTPREGSPETNYKRPPDTHPQPRPTSKSPPPARSRSVVRRSGPPGVAGVNVSSTPKKSSRRSRRDRSNSS